MDFVSWSAIVIKLNRGVDKIGFNLLRFWVLYNRKPDYQPPPEK